MRRCRVRGGESNERKDEVEGKRGYKYLDYLHGREC
jgi:hypothetical protein